MSPSNFGSAIKLFSRNRGAARFGFSLAELAIVLGILGIVLGGLWSAVGGVRENARRELAAEEAMTITANMRNFFQAQASAALSSYSSASAYTTYLAKSGVVPLEMIRDRTAASFLVDLPWSPSGNAKTEGGLVLCAGANCGLSATSSSDQNFMLRLNNIPYGACWQLLGKLTGPGGLGGVAQLVVNGTTYDATTNGYPVASSWARANCKTDTSAGPLNIINFALRIRHQGISSGI